MSTRGFGRSAGAGAMFLLCAATATAADLRGLVRLRTLAGETIAGVEINGSGAAPAATDSAGEFRLDFAKLKPGQPATLTKVSKPGLVVLHELMLHPILLADPEVQPPWEIILCQEAERTELALEYFRLKAGRSIDAFEQTRRAELLAQGGGTADQLKQLKEELAQARQQAGGFAEQIARSKPGTGNPESEQAMALFLQGKTKEALEVLSEARLEAEEAQQKQVERQNREKLARDYLLRAQLLANSLDFAGAARTYTRAAEKFPDVYDVQYEAGQYSYFSGQIAAARQPVERALELARASKNPDEIASAAMMLGNIHQTQNRVPETIAAYQEVVAIWKKDPEAKAGLAGTLTNLGTLYNSLRRRPEARQSFEEAIAILRELSAGPKPDPDYLSSLAGAVGQLGQLHRIERHLDLARPLLEEALALRRRLLALEDSRGNRYLLATNLNTMGALQRDEKRVDDARATLLESLAISKELAKANPAVNLPLAADTLNSLANLELDTDHVDAARAAYTEAIEIRRRQAATDPDEALPTLAQSLYNLALLERDNDQPVASAHAFQESIELRRTLAKANPERFAPQLADSLRGFAALEKNAGRLESARQASSEALAIRRHLAENKPELYRRAVANSLFQLAGVEQSAHRLDEARRTYGEGLALAEKIAAEFPTQVLTPGVEAFKTALKSLDEPAQVASAPKP